MNSRLWKLFEKLKGCCCDPFVDQSEKESQQNQIVSGFFLFFRGHLLNSKSFHHLKQFSGKHFFLEKWWEERNILTSHV